MGRMPAVFFGHGSPMIALTQDATTRRWREIALEIGRPKGIVCISAHWCTQGQGVTAMERPPTIHDFGNFPRALHEMQYPAPGDPALAARVAELLAPEEVHMDLGWGMDHGCWTVLHHAYPEADIPVIQVSLDVGKAAFEHFETGAKLGALRDEGYLLMGSGNIVHNTRTVIRNDTVPAFDWAERFGQAMRDAIAADEPQKVIDFMAYGADAQLSAPTPEHFWPLLYVLGARRPDDEAVFGPTHMQYGSIDMTTVVLREAA